MKKNSLLSLFAVALTIACSTPMAVSAAENKKPENYSREVLKSQSLKAYENSKNGKEVINGLPINVNTKIGDYAKEQLINELEESAKSVELNIDINEEAGILENYINLQAEIEKAIKNDTDNERNKYSSKVDDFIEANDNGMGVKFIEDRINVSEYGTLKAGVNSKGKNVVALFKNGKIIGMIGNDEVSKLQDGLDKVSREKLESVYANNKESLK